MNNLVIVILFFAISVVTTRILTYIFFRSNKLVSLLKKHRIIIASLIILAIGSLPVIVRILLKDRVPFGEITQIFLRSFLFSVMAVLIYDRIAYAQSQKSFKEVGGVKVNILDNIRLTSEISSFLKTRIEQSTLERFGLSSATGVSFQTINRLGSTKIELALLGQDIDSLKAAST